MLEAAVRRSPVFPQRRRSAAARSPSGFSIGRPRSATRKLTRAPQAVTLCDRLNLKLTKQKEEKMKTNHLPYYLRREKITEHVHSPLLPYYLLTWETSSIVLLKAPLYSDALSHLDKSRLTYTRATTERVVVVHETCRCCQCFRDTPSPSSSLTSATFLESKSCIYAIDDCQIRSFLKGRGKVADRATTRFFRFRIFVIPRCIYTALLPALFIPAPPLRLPVRQLPRTPELNAIDAP